MKKRYEQAELELLRLYAADILTESPTDPYEQEPGTEDPWPVQP